MEGQTVGPHLLGKIRTEMTFRDVLRFLRVEMGVNTCVTCIFLLIVRPE